MTEDCKICVIEKDCDEVPYEPIIPKETIRDILQEGDQLRFSKEIQEEFNKVNHSEWFVTVVNNMYISLLRKRGYGPVMAQALDELYSCRWIYRKDPEMNKFFDTLVHVRLDFTGEGQLKPGDVIPDLPLYTLDKELISLHHFVKEAQNQNKPLVIFGGSWT
jgi:hypothetical protein